ncbi:MAG: Xylose isomerase domain protein TIM barrel [Methanomicrobiales archaeon 53_19]|uniref:sugar phosphate isomerase/epimerase family protein n=1 Tax=Methanocalculus sp. TaxID=2004547 RepID=UPI000746630B|nr:sugar phosphate isomerase/epimerase family protein [Methanocalculus sp.]KUK69107.1 MAG: Xylose isomerase domain protein TIM barrel [Methanocalculus sp. 52_23]KUL03461.1 MAG: Xylose isomerase domain protein TIM barrel [Methanomicrobiales archaeon 53_19]HIJ07730.1 sugar phosphate isomerase/epimerase [Methanocalculus sp.]
MFAVSTFCLHHEPLGIALEKLAPITGSVEVMDDGLHYIGTPEILESYSFSYSIHAPSRGVNIASLLEPIRKASVQVTEECFAIAAEVGAPVIVHPGYFAWLEEREMAERQMLKSIAELRALAEERGVELTIENMGNWDYFFLRTPDELPLIEGTSFTLDIGHAHQNSCLHEFLIHPFAHIHVHDNNGTSDSHSPVGEGTIDFDAVMDAIRREQVIPVMEVGTLEGVMESVRVLGL